ncbi:30S ribosomal protein S4 [Patescibacteria group bacterium]|nr:30S ribosomal protein S4 [Patescibacteria group bacterium]
MKSSPQCKICRREGKKLFLKGDRCNSQKCVLVKKKYPPGAHGPKGYGRISDYGRQLREKQKLRRSYYVSEKQFKNYFVKAKKKEGNTEEIFLAFLEKRLDNVVYRAGFASSRRQARQLISHGNILVNGRLVDVPSYQVKTGDAIQPKEKKAIIEKVKEKIEQVKDRDTFPAWASLDKKKPEIKILKNPASEDLPQTFETELIIGFYSR